MNIKTLLQGAIICFTLSFTGCATSSGPDSETQPFWGSDKPTTIRGTLPPGEMMAMGREPRPMSSKVFITEEAGFGLVKDGAQYYIDLRFRKPPAESLQVRVEWENPLDKNQPLLDRFTIKAGTKDVRMASSEFVAGLKVHKIYSIKVTVLDSNRSPIDLLNQPVISYVDNIGGQTRIFKGLQHRDTWTRPNL